MAIKTFTMEEVDQEIVEIVEQANGEGQLPNNPPSIIKSLMEKAKEKRAGK